MLYRAHLACAEFELTIARNDRWFAYLHIQNGGSSWMLIIVTFYIAIWYTLFKQRRTNVILQDCMVLKIKTLFVTSNASLGEIFDNQSRQNQWKVAGLILFYRFRSRWFRFVSFRFVSFSLISFRFVSFRFYFVSHFIDTLKLIATI
jgi:hypothetical protein